MILKECLTVLNDAVDLYSVPLVSTNCKTKKKYQHSAIHSFFPTLPNRPMKGRKRENTRKREDYQGTNSLVSFHYFWILLIFITYLQNPRTINRPKGSSASPLHENISEYYTIRFE